MKGLISRQRWLGHPLQLALALGLLGAMVLPTSAARAGEFTKCKVVEVVADAGNNGHVGLNCDVSGRPTCAVAGSYVAFDKLSEPGKQWLSAFLAAQASGALVSGMTVDSCSPWQPNAVMLWNLRIISSP